MDRKEYSRCVGDMLHGKKLSKEERQVEFCASSKLCSGKAKTREEALALCALPKKPAQPVAPKDSVERVHSDDLGHKFPECQTETFFEAAKQFKKLYAYVKPYDSNCGACSRMDEEIKNAEVPYPIVQIPGDRCVNLADALGVDKYPTVVLLKKGKVISRHIGNPDAVIRKMVEGK